MIFFGLHNAHYVLISYVLFLFKCPNPSDLPYECIFFLHVILNSSGIVEISSCSIWIRNRKQMLHSYHLYKPFVN